MNKQYWENSLLPITLCKHEEMGNEKDEWATKTR